MHGFPDTLETWAATESLLEKQKHRVINVALRGYPPSSTARDNDYSLPALAGDILALLDRLNIESATLVGHDWGASIAYLLAAMAPNRVHSLVALAIPPLSVFENSLEEQKARPHNEYLSHGAVSADHLLADDLQEIEALYQLWSPHWQVPRQHLETVRQALEQPCRARAAVDFYRHELSKAQQKKFLVPLSTPALLIYGSDEPAVRKRMFDNADKAFISSVQTRCIDKVGHWPHLEAPQQFHEMLIQFLEQSIRRATRQAQ